MTGLLTEISPPRWIISDTHFGHANILAHCPWRQTWARTIEEHDQALITAWRDLVQSDDWVLHLGDFALADQERISAWRRSLPGRICIVHGNHDRSHRSLRDAGFDLVATGVRIAAGGRSWIARHQIAAFQIREAVEAERLFHGHSHGNGLRDDIHPALRLKALDCSLDALRSQAPVPWEAVTQAATP